MMVLVPLLSTLNASPWLTVFLVGALAVAWLALVAIWISYDKGDLWM